MKTPTKIMEVLWMDIELGNSRTFVKYLYVLEMIMWSGLYVVFKKNTSNLCLSILQI